MPYHEHRPTRDRIVDAEIRKLELRRALARAVARPQDDRRVTGRADRPA